MLQPCFLLHPGRSWLCYPSPAVGPPAVPLLKFVLINYINVVEDQADAPQSANLGHGSLWVVLVGPTLARPTQESCL